ncbi:heterogeneous nuclear ribonucleoprotein C isoform X2 [Aethina tumida]|uniref:heterogeneous nuclear ribonucleoprotein C isoform X2 n=1 Tax=Aethina tumida TaxID=116153 RepID=UPI0021480008|nr:heterogeneous nuclear ribonucleoprotein C isoform X2 [Aethina tumida]
MDILELNKITVAVQKVKANQQKQAAKMKMSKVGNQTNSQDPQAVNSRVFVGNLNTFQCSKTDVERMFQRYGRLAGISMHKGYAFVQFTNPFDARSACLGEDGRTVLSQILDVNMVAEPKPHQTGRKRQNVAKTGNDWDYYYDSYYASTAFPVAPTRLVPPIKRQRLMTTARNGKNNQSQKTTSIPPLDQLKVYSNQDILICGNCREMFSDLHDLLDHKKTYCKLRFTCKCDTNKSKSPTDDNTSASLLCVQCKDSFQNAWDLMVHAQAAHMLNIYELGVPAIANCSSPPLSPRDNTPDKENKNESTLDGEEENGDGDHEPDFMENGRDGLTGTPDSANSRNDKELEDLMDVEPTAKTCIMHALSIVSAPASQPGSSPPPLAAVAPHTDHGDAWKPQGHTRLSPKLQHEPY